MTDLSSLKKALKSGNINKNATAIMINEADESIIEHVCKEEFSGVIMSYTQPELEQQLRKYQIAQPNKVMIIPYDQKKIVEEYANSSFVCIGSAGSNPDELADLAEHAAEKLKIGSVIYLHGYRRANTFGRLVFGLINKIFKKVSCILDYHKAVDEYRILRKIRRNSMIPLEVTYPLCDYQCLLSRLLSRIGRFGSFHIIAVKQFEA